MKQKTYSTLKLTDLQAMNLQFISERLFFPPIPPVPPSDFLQQTMQRNQGVALISEKAKSEHLIAPILNEVRLNNPKSFTYYSGCIFEVDKKKGLTGFCDFILSKPPLSLYPQAPILIIAEAKKDDMEGGTIQCAAEMYAAQLFNERHAENIRIIHGVVTSGYEWLFLKLEGNIVRIDTERYHLHNLSELLGVWQKVIDFYREEAL